METCIIPRMMTRFTLLRRVRLRATSQPSSADVHLGVEAGHFCVVEADEKNRIAGRRQILFA